MSYWESQKNGTVFAHGPKETLPSAAVQKQLRDGGYKITIKQSKDKEQ